MNDLANLTQGWTAPAELAGSPPRQVRYSAVGILVAVVMLTLVVGGGLLAYYLYRDATQQTANARLLAEQGTETMGTVTRLWRGGSKNRSFLVAYEFQAGGHVFHGEARTPRSFWENLSEGQRLTVQYVAADPLTNRPRDVPAADPPIWAVLFIPAAFVGVAAFLVYRMRRQRRLLEDGRAAPGVITRVRRTKNGRAIRYDFLLPAGNTMSGSGIAKSGPSEVGSVITVVYDPDNPGRNGPYPLELVKLAR